jgi:AcrR family transcriptional regulator
MRSSPNPKVRRKSASDALILDAARRLFLARGVAGVNMDQIAAEAGVARQTIYNRFENKEAVFKSAIEVHWETLNTELSDHLSLDIEPEIVLRNIAQDVLRFIDEHEQVAMTRMIISESLHDPTLAESFYRLGKLPIRSRFLEYVRETVERGILECAQPEIACAQFLGMIQEALFWPRVMGLDVKGPSEESVVDNAISTFMARYQPTQR